MPFNAYEERSNAAGRLLPGFVGAAILLAARADPTGPEGQRWDSYMIRGGLPTNLALAAQLIVDLPAYLIQGPQHVETRGAVRTFQGTTLPQNAVEILGVHLAKGSDAAWAQLQEVFSRVCLVGGVFDAARVYTFIRLWYPVGVVDARAMGSIALFSNWAIAHLLEQSQAHFRPGIARRVFEELPGSIDSIDGE